MKAIQNQMHCIWFRIACELSDNTEFVSQNPLPNAWNWTSRSKFWKNRFVFDATPCGFTFDLPARGRFSAFDLFKVIFSNDSCELVIHEILRYELRSICVQYKWRHGGACMERISDLLEWSPLDIAVMIKVRNRNPYAVAEKPNTVISYQL